MGRIFIRVGSEEIDLTGSDEEMITNLGKILKTDTWQSSLSKIRKARDTAIEAATRSALDAKIPERGSSFGQFFDLRMSSGVTFCGGQELGEIWASMRSGPPLTPKSFENKSYGPGTMSPGFFYARIFFMAFSQVR